MELPPEHDPIVMAEGSQVLHAEHAVAPAKNQISNHAAHLKDCVARFAKNDHFRFEYSLVQKRLLAFAFKPRLPLVEPS